MKRSELLFELQESSGIIEIACVYEEGNGVGLADCWYSFAQDVE
jgi:hypothetical protein